MNKTIHYLPCSVVCHGECELVLVRSIQNKKRRFLNPLSERNGKSSIEINTLNKFLNRRYPTKADYIKENKSVLCLKNKKEIINHKIFSLMDKDNTDDYLFNAYKNKTLFSGFWWGEDELIFPLYFYPDMDTVFSNHGYPINVNKHKPTQYFRYLTTDYDGVIRMLSSLDPKESNIRELLDYLNSLK